jgi:hypothetical protein
MIPAFEREKTVHALDRAVAVIGNNEYIVGTNLEEGSCSLFQDTVPVFTLVD